MGTVPVRRSTLAAWLSLPLLALALSGASHAQGQPPVPLGDPFDVAADPVGEQSHADVARNRDGSFVVVWRHQPWIEHGEWNIHARRFDADGQPRGAGYRVNVAPVDEYGAENPRVAARPDGGFVVVWSSYDPAPLWSDVFVRIYDAGANPAGPPFLAPEDPTGSERYPDVAVESGGNFAVIWSESGSVDSFEARVFDSGGSPRTGDFVVSPSSDYTYYGPSLAASGPGEFVVGYSSYYYSYPSYGSQVLGQKFDVDGHITVAEFRVDEGSGAGYSYYGSPVKLDSGSGGDFTVLWPTSYPTSDVRMRRFSSDAQPLGGEIVVGEEWSEHELAVSPGGRSLVSWGGWSGPLQAQLWSPDGTPEGPPFEVVDPATQGFHLRAALDASESPVFVWHEWRVNQGDDVVARRFQTFERIFLDGFESGDAGRWSAVMP